MRIKDNMATQEERKARAALEHLKGKVEALIGLMENTLATNPTSASGLQRRIKSTEEAWTEFKVQYDRLCAIAGENQAKQDHTNYDTV